MVQSAVTGQTSLGDSGSFKRDDGDNSARNWGRHSIDLRFSIPFIGGRYYLTLVGGRELRNPDRRQAEREHHPLRTAGNLFFFLGAAAVFYLIVAVSVALQSSLIEF